MERFAPLESSEVGIVNEVNVRLDPGQSHLDDVTRAQLVRAGLDDVSHGLPFVPVPTLERLGSIYSNKCSCGGDLLAVPIPSSAAPVSRFYGVSAERRDAGPVAVLRWARILGDLSLDIRPRVAPGHRSLARRPDLASQLSG